MSARDDGLLAVARAICADDSDRVHGARCPLGSCSEPPGECPYMDNARAAIAAYLADLARRGLAVVPREPTREMRLAGNQADYVSRQDGDWSAVYRAMVAAAPPPEPPA